MPKGRPNRSMERVNIYVPRSVVDRYRKFAKATDLPYSELMRRGLAAHSSAVMASIPKADATRPSRAALVKAIDRATNIESSTAGHTD